MKELTVTVMYGEKDITNWIVWYIMISLLPKVFTGIRYLIHDMTWLIGKVGELVG